GLRIEQQADQVLDLLGSEGAGVAEARHVRAQVVRLGVIDLAVHVALHFRAVAALRAEAEQAWADRAVRRFLGRELVAVIAAAAVRRPGRVGPLHAAAALRDALAVLPVADQAALRIGDGLQLVFFELLGEAGG